jgi:hypothetical protein
MMKCHETSLRPIPFERYGTQAAFRWEVDSYQPELAEEEDLSPLAVLAAVSFL